MKYSKPDKFELQATIALKDFFEKHKEDVFYSRQLEVMFEDKYFHWITNRVIRELLKEGFIKSEDVELFSGAWMRLIFHSSLRYYKTRLKNVVALVKEYSDPIISEVIGLHAEHLFLEGFSKNRFTLEGRNTREFNSHEWTKSDHNLDFIFKRDNLCYGTEIKNSLSYIDEKELEIKIELCKFLGIIPLFIVRMAPGRYIDVVKKAGGFTLIFKYQLYPTNYRELTKRMRQELKLPADCPRAIEQGTISRFEKWHIEKVKCM